MDLNTFQNDRATATPCRAALWLATRRLMDWLTVALLLAGLCLPLAGAFFSWGHPVALRENRRLAVLPRISSLRPYELVAFNSGVQHFIRDRFGFRDVLIKWRSRLLVQGMRVSTNRSVLLGRDGWLFVTREKSVENFVRVIPYSSAELDRMSQMIERRAQWLAARNAKYVFVVAPAKESIYPQFMPDYLQQRRQQGPSRLDQLSDRFSRATDVLFVDLRAPLRAAAEYERVFKLTDTHWNDRGAYAAYRSIIEQMAQRGWYSGQPAARSTLREATVTTPGGDLAGMLGLEDVLLEEDLRLQYPVVLSWRDAQARLNYGQQRPAESAVIFGDSFLSALAPYFAGNFRGICATGPFDPGIVEKEKPRFVIEEIAERRLTFPPPTEGEQLPAAAP